MGQQIGTVGALWRYPVKSMQGERVDAATVSERGLAGDRRWAIVDAQTGKVASAKHPKLWLSLLECQAAYAQEPEADGDAATVRITLPDGREVRSDDPDRDELLSAAFGRPVTLQSRAAEGATFVLRRLDAEGFDAPEPEALTESAVGSFAPPGTFFDTSALHLVATSTLEGHAAAHPDGQWDPRRFRPNVLVEVADPPDDEIVENAWVGRALELGTDARAAVLAPMPRCVMTTLPQQDLPRDPRVLRTLAERNKVTLEGHGTYACLGVLATVAAPGTLALHDPVALGDAL